MYMALFLVSQYIDEYVQKSAAFSSVQEQWKEAARYIHVHAFYLLATDCNTLLQGSS